MKIDRRCFLSLGLGAALGIVFTPLPWKLTDDLSIWTQTWPWTPVPERGPITYVDTTCTLCPGACGISVRKAGQQAIKIEGKAGHPVNNGGICALGLSGLQLLYGPTRVKTPLMRTGQRGAGKWKPISWDQAIATVAQRLSKLRAAGQPNALAVVAGTDQGSVAALFQRLLTVYGSPNFIRIPSVQDAFETVLYMTTGQRGSVEFDFANSDYVISFAAGLLDGWQAPVSMFQAFSGWKQRGTHLVQVEPRMSNTAAKADQWVAAHAGTESALALGLAHVIIAENLYDTLFVRDEAFGFDPWRDEKGNDRKGFKDLVLQYFAPGQVAAITGVPADTIVALAREFAKAKAPVAVCGRGNGQRPGAVGETLAVFALNALVGAINRKGGVHVLPPADYINWPEPEMDAVAAAGMQQERIDGAGTQKYLTARYLLNRLAGAVDAATPYPIDTLLVHGANPLYSQPGAGDLKRALAKIGFVVSFSSFMDETAVYSDLILPDHFFLEKTEDVNAPPGFARPMLGLCTPAVKVQFNTRHTGDVLLELAAKIGAPLAQAFPWKDYRSCLKQTLGGMWERFSEKRVWVDSDFSPQNGAVEFETPSGKFEFFSSAHPLAETDAQTVARLVPPAPEGDVKRFPLVLMPYDSMHLASQAIGSPPFLFKIVQDTVLKGNDGFVELNPATAAVLGLAEGGHAMLTTPRGQARVRVHLSDGIGPGMLAMVRGLGHSAYDAYLAGKGTNFNALIAPVPDPASGLDAAWGIRATLMPA